MQIFEAIILGLVQGLTEFLPVSSSAHLRVVGEFLPSAADPGATFTAITQIGTEIAVLVYFGPKIWRIIKNWGLAVAGKIPMSDPDARLGWLVILGSIPIGILGFTLQEYIRDAFRNLWIVAAVLIGFGIILGMIDRFASRRRVIDDVTYPHGLTIGIAQALALVPGVSRSGATISMARGLGYDRKSAAEFAFLLAIPAVMGSGLFELRHGLQEGSVGPYGWTGVIIATVVAGVVGWLVIAYLMRYLERGSFMPFVIYRVVIGSVIMVLLAIGVLTPYGGA
ncbi:undecaprenyl-diphosphate phosphatase [Microbacterium amylolyticum]|uniref:Undecaprenyl-diphosphatase n=1 Tax=Microbacterium amylolyticum TaxID=936337 RepID=A0ABS4ZEW5_9MICO|nr:undecaprenyl-diphosphate phosphatase [Microbacterium amylolyticum]MBP2435804.1 undecaprenyl-diphosphatase [Microbacterium amylolyticum]